LATYDGGFKGAILVQPVLSQAFIGLGFAQFAFNFLPMLFNAKLICGHHLAIMLVFGHCSKVGTAASPNNSVSFVTVRPAFVILNLEAAEAQTLGWLGG
jgi:hypothetical protein